MTIRPVVLNGMMQRTNDVSNVKQNADNKPVVEQQVIQTKQQKETAHHLKQVRHGDDTQQHEKKYDAKEKGGSEYENREGTKKKKEEEKQSQGKVVQKIQRGGFDMKI